MPEELSADDRYAANLSADSRVVLMGRLRQMAEELEQLQSQIAAVEAFVAVPGSAASVLGRTAPAPTEPSRHASRPGAGWTPSPTPQPWLEARSA